MFGRGTIILAVRGPVVSGSPPIGRIPGGRRFSLRFDLGRSFGGVGRLCGIRWRGLVLALSVCDGDALARLAPNDNCGDLFAGIVLEASFRGLLLGDRDADGGFTVGFVSTVGGRGFGRDLFVRGRLHQREDDRALLVGLFSGGDCWGLLSRERVRSRGLDRGVRGVFLRRAFLGCDRELLPADDGGGFGCWPGVGGRYLHLPAGERRRHLLFSRVGAGLELHRRILFR
jgi:hypothetical protein